MSRLRLPRKGLGELGRLARHGKRIGAEAEARAFSSARRFARSLGLTSARQWRGFCAAGKCPADIPRSPHYVYRDEGWVSWGDWLGTGTVAPGNVPLRPFREARSFVRGLGLRRRAEWFRFCRGECREKGRRPSDIPADPTPAYRDEWVDWRDFLGTASLPPGKSRFRSFEQAREYVIGLGLTGTKQWRQLCADGQVPADIPRSPNGVYRNRGWVSWGDWLGTGAVASHKITFRAFTEARAFARGLELASVADWRRYCRRELPGQGRRPADVPSNPYQVYRDEWVSWMDFLGTASATQPRRS